MKICLIGPGDIEYHFSEVLKLKKVEINTHIEKLARKIVDLNSELVLLPDRGICFELAKKYKEMGGKKVTALVPQDDTGYGITHLQKYLNFEINGKKVFDEIINSGDWYKTNQTHCLFGDKILLLGYSLGSIGELSFGYYLFKLFKGHKKEVEVSLKKINSSFLAGENFSFDTIIYSPFVKEKLNFEIENYIRKVGGKIKYISNEKELEEALK